MSASGPHGPNGQRAEKDDKALIRLYDFQQEATQSNLDDFAEGKVPTSTQLAKWGVHGERTTAGVLKTFKNKGIVPQARHISHHEKLIWLKDTWGGNWWPEGWLPNPENPPLGMVISMTSLTELWLANEPGRPLMDLYDESEASPGFVVQAMRASSSGLFTTRAVAAALRLFKEWHNIVRPRARRLPSEVPSSVPTGRATESELSRDSVSLAPEFGPDGDIVDLFDITAPSVTDAAAAFGGLEEEDTVMVDRDDLEVIEPDFNDAIPDATLGSIEMETYTMDGDNDPSVSRILSPGCRPNDQLHTRTPSPPAVTYDSDTGSEGSIDGVILHMLGQPGSDLVPTKSKERLVAEITRAKEERSIKRKRTLEEKLEAADAATAATTEENIVEEYGTAVDDAVAEVGKRLNLGGDLQKRIAVDISRIVREEIIKNL